MLKKQERTEWSCVKIFGGGTTPSPATIEWAREYLSIDLFVLIRPRSGDFCYDKTEFQVIQREILWCKENGVDGIVIGILTSDGKIDINRTEKLVHLAHPMEVTFHRAFDFVQNPILELQNLIHLGVNRILTSGQESTAIKGSEQIKQLLELAQNKIKIMAGGGLNPNNIEAFVRETGVQEIHLSGKQLIKSTFHSKVTSLNQEGIPELDYLETCRKTIQSTLKIISKLK